MAGGRALFEGHEEPLKGWKLRKKLCCINEHQKVTGGTRVMMGKNRQVLQKQFAPPRGRYGTIRPETVELVPALNLKATHRQEISNQAPPGGWTSEIQEGSKKVSAPALSPSSDSLRCSLACRRYSPCLQMVSPLFASVSISKFPSSIRTSVIRN